ncbi:MAG: hypothetical protein L0Z49_05285, partial [Actinobacteria bacterium]|nr:hypothetical protein [Actinomycetota bacterium]
MRAPRHVILDGITFRIDELADVPFRRVADSVMVPRADISGAPGAVNLQRDVWLWASTDFRGGEGRLVFDSADPLGPPAFYKSDGGIDVRKAGEFSLHPDERLIANPTGGGAAPTVTTWTNTDFTTVQGSPTFSAAHAGTHVRLDPGERIRSPARTPSAGANISVEFRFVQAMTTSSNSKVTVEAEILDNTEGTVVSRAEADLRDQEKWTATLNYTAASGHTYHYRLKNIDGGSGVTIDVKYVTERVYGSGNASPQDIRDVRLGIGGEIWATAYDGDNTDILVWDFQNDTWTQFVANMVAASPRGFTGSDQFMYVLDDTGDIWQIGFDIGARKYAHDPATAGPTAFAGNHGDALGLAVANNRLYALYQQGLFELTVDVTSGLPLSEGEDYNRVASPGEFFKELSPNISRRQRISSISNGVRFYTNVLGEQATIWEFSGSPGVLTPTHFLPIGYEITAIRHYANITFITASFTNQASEPAEKHTGVFFITSDNLLRFLGYLRFHETNSQPVAYITAYGHDVYFLQGRRLWRYNLGAGGITLENEIDAMDETQVRALARMDKKFWVAVETQGTFVADDSYSTTTAYLTSPLWDFDVPDLDKTLLSFDVVTRPLPSNTVVSMEYSLDEGAWTSAGTITTAGTVKTRMSISSSSSTVKFRDLQWRIGLTSTDGQSTPRVLSVTARIYVLDYEDSFDMTLLMEDDTSGDRLVREQLSAKKKLERLWTLKTTKELFTFTDHFSSSKPGEGDSYTVVLEDPFQETFLESERFSEPVFREFYKERDVVKEERR